MHDFARMGTLANLCAGGCALNRHEEDSHHARAVVGASRGVEGRGPRWGAAAWPCRRGGAGEEDEAHRILVVGELSYAREHVNERVSEWSPTQFAGGVRLLKKG